MRTGLPKQYAVRERAASRMILGMDMGGTTLRAALVDERGEAGEILRFPVPADRAGQARLPVAVAEQFAGEPSAIGLAIAGTVAGGIVTRTPNLQLAGTDLGSSLCAVSQGRAVVANDATAAAVAEARLGAGSGEHLVFAITVGTGIGGALLLNGRPLEGRGAAGEVGHMVIHPDGPACGCGRRGCWETYCSGRALDRAAALLLAGGETEPSARDLVHAAEHGNEAAAAAVSRAASDFRLGIDNICAIINPDLIILGGGVFARAGLVSEAYLAAIAQLRWGAATRIARSKLGDRAGLIGASMLARDAYPAAGLTT
jgi:glucokinase